MIRNSKGFSLIEVVVVVAIMGIVTAIAIPNMISWRAANKLRGVTAACQSDMQKAKLAAIKYGATGIVDFAVAGFSYRAYVDMDMDGAFNSANDRVLAERTLPSGVTLTSASFFGSGSKICFNSQGLPVGVPNGTVVFTNSAGSSGKVVVNRIGRIYIVW